VEAIERGWDRLTNVAAVNVAKPGSFVEVEIPFS
jgi:hypothetical protein